MPYDPLGTPTRAQIESMQKLCAGTRYVVKIDDGSEFDSAFYMMVWDDDHELLHVCKENTDFNTQSQCPISIRSIEYAQIRNINGYYI